MENVFVKASGLNNRPSWASSETSRSVTVDTRELIATEREILKQKASALSDLVAVFRALD